MYSRIGSDGTFPAYCYFRILEVRRRGRPGLSGGDRPGFSIVFLRLGSGASSSSAGDGRGNVTRLPSPSRFAPFARPVFCCSAGTKQLVLPPTFKKVNASPFGSSLSVFFLPLPQRHLNSQSCGNFSESPRTSTAVLQTCRMEPCRRWI